MEVEHQSDPYPHALIASWLGPQLDEAALDLLVEADWTREKGASFDFDRGNSLPLEDLLFASGAITRLRHRLVDIFALAPDRASVAFHRYAHHAGIGPHTDAEDLECRVVFNLNRGWVPRNGGIWLLSTTRTLSASRRCIAPHHDTGFAFITAEKTFHAMTNVADANLYAIIIGFKLVDAPPWAPRR